METLNRYSDPSNSKLARLLLMDTTTVFNLVTQNESTKLLCFGGEKRLYEQYISSASLLYKKFFNLEVK